LGANTNNTSTSTSLTNGFSAKFLNGKLQALSKSPPKIREKTPSRLEGLYRGSELSNGNNTPD
jgi:hypothetical protein